jgi:putative tryptophan/tyrosine transport system substrate-binding protein
MLHVRRRQFLTLLGSAVAALPLAAGAQQPGKIPRIGIIDDAPRWNAFRHRLARSRACSGRIESQDSQGPVNGRVWRH